MATSEEVMRCQRRKKMFAIEAFGGECQLCGYNRCINALGFHHINPDEKTAEPSYVIMRWSWKRAKKELDKCILVCANCHAELHYEDKIVDLQIYIKKWLTIMCLSCEKQFETKNEEQTYCSQRCAKVGQRKVERPSKENLKQLLETTSWKEIGRIYNVSDNAVRKWAKKYELIC